ncbi:DNA-directed RNA polymerase III, subunit Rpc31 [Coprinopsis sp. MPI-PUGE-AT-0042]|nr:DNA-directed RNA polymerase III, subunit Rpc31 [Coprinopsis sp. MPI-PUGE-AT-0042]
MGLTFADIQNLSREGTALYPPRHQPVFIEPSPDEKRITELQLGIVSRLRTSQYYITEQVKSTDLPRYSDKYRPSINNQPSLKRKDLHAPFFPPSLLEEYFNPRGRTARSRTTGGATGKAKVNLDELVGEDDDQEKSGDERSDAEDLPEEDYDVDEEFDNDYAENYFDNGEGDDYDNLGDGGADEGGGGGGDYD